MNDLALSTLSQFRPPCKRLRTNVCLRGEDIEARRRFLLELDVCLQEVLHFGVISMVWVAKHRLVNATIAIKVSNKANGAAFFSTRDSNQRVTDEFSLLRQLDHRNILSCSSTYESSSHVYSALAYMENGDLVADVQRVGSYSNLSAQRLARQILAGVTYLQQLSILHRDIKPDNIFLTSAERSLAIAKISDFGYARRCQSPCQCYSFLGTITYMAPEVLRNSIVGCRELRIAYGFPVDTWSCGLTFYAALTGMCPYDVDFDIDDQGSDLRSQVLAGKVYYDPVDWQGKHLAMSFVQALAHYLPEKRLSLEKAMEHPWWFFSTILSSTHV